jgi:Asp/Glu/hydantoin racemase
VLDRIVGERPLDMTVDETACGNRTFERLTEAGNQLIGDGADAIVLGCAGMARHRRPLERALGVPVVEPTQAAVAMALGAVLAGAA